jgi:GTP pyrophosphokinase
LARSKIRRWFRRHPDAAKVTLGRQQLYQVIERLALRVPDLNDLAKRFTYEDETSLFSDIGGCDLPLERVIPVLIDTYGMDQLPLICDAAEHGISIVGTGSLDRSVAQCCQPKQGDDIVGYILSSQHLVEVHRSDCEEFLLRMDEDPSRFVEVKWGRVCETHTACMAIVAHDRPFFLRDVWNIISDQDLNVADVEVKVNRAEDARITICVDIENWLQFHEVLTRIADLPGAISVRRQPQPVDLSPEHAREELLA